MTARTKVWSGITVAAMVVASVYVAGCLSRQADDTISLVMEAQAQGGPLRDNMIDGTLHPQGYTPMAIKNGNYPGAYYPVVYPTTADDHIADRDRFEAGDGRQVRRNRAQSQIIGIIVMFSPTPSNRSLIRSHKWLPPGTHPAVTA